MLFTIAQDLKDMEVAASLDEADIGSIREGQSAFFTVDAYGNRKFQGRVSQIRKAAKTVQNVVTYTVIISAANRDMSLLPGMTADVRIVLQNRPQVLAAPNAALRFKPPEGAAETSSSQAQAGTERSGRAGAGRAGGAPGRAAGTQPPAETDPAKRVCQAPRTDERIPPAARPWAGRAADPGPAAPARNPAQKKLKASSCGC